MPVTRQDISGAAAANGLAGAALCVHSSLGSFGRVVGGARAVVVGLLDAGCTVMVPAFTYDLAVAQPPGRALLRNAWGDRDDDGLPPATEEVYTPDRNDVSEWMGAVPAAVLETAGRARGDHPLNSFAAAGPLASDLIAGQAPLDVFAPFRELARINGYVVMMGVDLRTMTALHRAEQMAGRTPFRRWASGADGGVVEAECGGCSRGFNAIEPALSPVERRATVGSSVWRIFPAADVLERASAAIRERPEITRCDVADCDRCEDGIAGGPVLEISKHAIDKEKENSPG